VSHHLHLDPDSALELAEDVASFLTAERLDSKDDDIRDGFGTTTTSSSSSE
jgi:hypothetical protein